MLGGCCVSSQLCINHLVWISYGIKKTHFGWLLRLSSEPSMFEADTIRLFQKALMQSACYRLVPPVLPTGLRKAMPCVIYVSVTMHLKDPQLFAVRVEHRVL